MLSKPAAAAEFTIPTSRPGSTSPRAESDAPGAHDPAPRANHAPEITQSVVLLDPKSVAIPLTPNRVEDAFESEAYYELRDSIVASRGNLVPIEVRRVDGDSGQVYELVYGERRLRACIHARILVRAIVSTHRESDDSFLKRMRENRGRADLAPLEFGRQVKHVLDGDPSLARGSLADQLGCSVSLISRAYDLANLPEFVITAFESPHDLRYEDVKVLRDAFRKDPKAVEEEASRIHSGSQSLAAREVVMRLVKAATPQVASCKQENHTSPTVLQCDARRVGSWCVTSRGTLELQVELAMSDAQRMQLGEHIVKFLARKVLGARATSNGSAGTSQTL